MICGGAAVWSEPPPVLNMRKRWPSDETSRSIAQTWNAARCQFFGTRCFNSSTGGSPRFRRDAAPAYSDPPPRASTGVAAPGQQSHETFGIGCTSSVHAVEDDG